MLYLKTDGVWRDDGTFEFLEMGASPIEQSPPPFPFVLALCRGGEGATGLSLAGTLRDSLAVAPTGRHH